jgi:hypothetical protein
VTHLNLENVVTVSVDLTNFRVALSDIFKERLLVYDCKNCLFVMSKVENIFLSDTSSELNKSFLHMHMLRNLHEFHSIPYLIILGSPGGTI